jgi:hypothetical protein
MKAEKIKTMRGEIALAHGVFQQPVKLALELGCQSQSAVWAMGKSVDLDVPFMRAFTTANLRMTALFVF